MNEWRYSFSSCWKHEAMFSFQPVLLQNSLSHVQCTILSPECIGDLYAPLSVPSSNQQNISTSHHSCNNANEKAPKTLCTGLKFSNHTAKAWNKLINSALSYSHVPYLVPHTSTLLKDGRVHNSRFHYIQQNIQGTYIGKLKSSIINFLKSILFTVAKYTVKHEHKHRKQPKNDRESKELNDRGNSK